MTTREDQEEKEEKKAEEEEEDEEESTKEEKEFSNSGQAYEADVSALYDEDKSDDKDSKK